MPKGRHASSLRMTRASAHLRKIVVSALFLSLALLTGAIFSVNLPLFGENGMRVGISGVFSIMPSILFGPLYGGIVSGLSDVLGYLVKPSGAYMPLLTLTAFAGAFLRGLLWGMLRRADERKLRVAVVALAVLAAFAGAYNLFALSADGVDASFYESAGAPADLSGMRWISRLLIERTQATSNPGGNLATYIGYTTVGFLGFAAFGLAICAVDWALKRFFLKERAATGTVAILLAMMLSGLAVTTVNTEILRRTVFESWKLMPFTVVWLPRAIEEIVMNTVKCYFVALLYGVYLRIDKTGILK